MSGHKLRSSLDPNYYLSHLWVWTKPVQTVSNDNTESLSDRSEQNALWTVATPRGFIALTEIVLKVYYVTENGSTTYIKAHS